MFENDRDLQHACNMRLVIVTIVFAKDRDYALLLQ